MISLPDFPHGSFLVIRTDGREEIINERPTIKRIYELIACEGIESVDLRCGDLVMVVDDFGYEAEFIEHDTGHIELRPVRARKPINEKATRLYHRICHPGTSHAIVGDVAIVHDEDFE